MPHMALEIASLEPPGKDHGQQRSRHHADLAQLRHGTRQPPVGDADAHAALNNNWM